MDTGSIPQKDWQTEIYVMFAKLAPRLISLAHIVFYLQVIFLITAAFLEAQSAFYNIVYSFGKHLGQLASLTLCVIILPGIFGRFRVEIKLTRIITLFRRQLGIFAFITVFMHYTLVRMVPWIVGAVPFRLPLSLFEMVGVISLFILLFLFLTSNNYSMKMLGPWWKRLHRFVYLAVGILVLHTSLQRISPWSMLVGVFAVAEIVSWVVYWLRPKTVIVG